MLILVGELWPKPHLQAIEVPQPPLELASEAILYVPLPRRISLYQLDHLIPANWRRMAQSVVIRAHPAEASYLISDQEIQSVLSQRFERRPLWMASYRQGGYALDHLSSSEADPALERNQKFVIPQLRRAELLSLSRRPGALLPRDQDFHYEGPNGSHYETFLRVGTVLQTVDALDSVAFWLTPHAINHRIILLDSGALLSLGLNCTRYMTECGITNGETITKIECLRSYEESPQELIRRMRSLEPQDPALTKILFIVSVRSSGRIAKSVHQTCTEAGFREIDIVSLYSTPTSDAAIEGDAFCELDVDFQRYDKGDCPHCRTGNPLVKIEPNTYQLEVSAAVKTTRITGNDAENARHFLDFYRGTGSITVHRDREDGGRHHTIHIDVHALLERSETFRRRLAEKAERFKTRTDVIIGPTHPAAVALARYVAELLDVSYINLEEHEIPARVGDLRHCKNILLIDDAIITGNRLRGYKVFLRRAGIISKDSSISCLVGVARPTSSSSLQSIKDMVRPNFSSVEEVLLPNWSQEECPWCWECNQIRNLSAFLDNSAVMKKRYEMLRGPSKGLQTNLFLRWSESQDYELSLGPTAIFGEDLTHAELFFSVASALQNLRDRGALNEQFTTPIAKVLSPDHYLGGRFYDNIIIASILRGTRRHDLRATILEKKLRDFLRRRLNEDASVDLRAELLLAMAQGKLLVVQEAKPLDLLTPAGEPGIVNFLTRILGGTRE